MADDIIYFNEQTADRILAATQKVEAGSFGGGSSDSRPSKDPLIRISAPIVNEPGKYIAYAYAIQMNPSPGGLSLTQLYNTSNQGIQVEAWNLAEINVTSHKLVPSPTNIVASIGTLFGFNNTTQKYIYRVFITQGVSPGTQLYQVLQMTSLSSYGWDYVRAHGE